MRLFGHPVHVMLIHFPVALWPAHWLLHLLAGKLPAGVGPVAAFWLLAAGCGIGWLAALAGAADLLALSRENDERRLNTALIHAGVNGTALVGFTALAAMECAAYPVVAHGVGFLAGEAILLIALFAGNYFGGSLVWADATREQRGD